MRAWREHLARKIVRRRSEGWCEACDRRAATDWHHRQNRSQGGDWRPSNGMHLCRPCHRDITDPRDDTPRRNGWTIPRASDPSKERVWHARHGWCLLSDAGDITLLDRPVWAGGMQVRLDPRMPPGTAFITPIDPEDP